MKSQATTWEKNTYLINKNLSPEYKRTLTDVQMENCSTVSQKVKYIPTMWSSHCTPRCLPQIKNHMSEDLDMNVHSICNNPKVGVTQLSLSRWLAKPSVSHAHNGTPLSNGQGKATDTYNTWMNRKIICCVRKARRKVHPLCFRSDKILENVS